MIDDKLEDISKLSRKFYKKNSLQYFVEDGMDYIVNELIGLQPNEVDTYKSAASELSSMYNSAIQYVIDHQLWSTIGIPDNAIRIIEYTWKNRDRHLPIYGRFDISGVINGNPPKLIEFNADTATILPETAIIQKEQLAGARKLPKNQFNHIFDDLSAQFQKLLQANPDKEPYFLFSTMGHDEDMLNNDLLASAAFKAGFEVQHRRLDAVTFSPDEGILIQVGHDKYLPFDFWFKLVPWEHIAFEEPEIMDILTEIVVNEKAIIANPAYMMLAQSQALMKILWDLYPNHRLLLETQLTEHPFSEKPYVEKVIFGREGENIKVFNRYGSPLEENDGDFGNYPSIFQAFEELPQDSDGDYYQAGVYFAGQPSAISFRRRDGYIIDEDSEFIGHFIW